MYNILFFLFILFLININLEKIIKFLIRKRIIKPPPITIVGLAIDELDKQRSVIIR